MAGSEVLRWRGRVQRAVERLVTGLLAHPANDELRALHTTGALSIEHLYRRALQEIFRILLVLLADARAGQSGLSAELRSLLEAGSPEGGEGVASVARWLARLEDGGPGLPALGAIEALSRYALTNLHLRGVLAALLSEDGAALPAGSAELSARLVGETYEATLALAPRWDAAQGRLVLGEASRGDRHATGSFYTPAPVVDALLDQVIEPMLDDAIAGKRGDDAARALLSLSVCDPACGTGHLLVAAGHRVARRLVAIEGGAWTPGAAMSAVVGSCLYGVDVDPIAVDLCRAALAFEAATAWALPRLSGRVLCGNTLLGATPEMMEGGVPDGAFDAVEGDDRGAARALKQQNALGRRPVGREALGGPRARLAADAWCAAFMLPKRSPDAGGVSLTSAVWMDLLDEGSAAPPLLAAALERLRSEHRFFHWHVGFAEVMARGGFDAIVGNPPWISHAGRAARRLAPRVRAFYEAVYPSFADFPTTHGVFVAASPRALRPGGRLGLIIPTSVSDLGGYQPTRLAHDALCVIERELVDLGEGRFAGVTQPCMALVSRRRAGGRAPEEQGKPWPMSRPDLLEVDRRLLARLAALPVLPGELFGERGFQSDRSLAEHFRESASPEGRFDTPIRDGGDIREFELLAPRLHVDARALGSRLRGAKQLEEVAALVRQTARYPIAAVADGMAFRNSLIACLKHPLWEADALVALLNSALVRWLHYQRHRDARQPVMPQVKVSHLRSLPSPPGPVGDAVVALGELGRRLRAGRERAGRAGLDAFVAKLYGLSDEEEARVQSWHERVGARGRVRREGPAQG